MTLKNNDRISLIKYRLEQARETIDDAKLLIENSKFRSAVNRIYYAMFYSLLALGLKYRFETSKHSKLIGWFNKNFVHAGKLDKKYGRIINRAFVKRIKGDYDSYIEFDKETVENMFTNMKEFIEIIEDIINQN